jgi:uncharacterized coiled-coil DUF342 family protein
MSALDDYPLPGWLRRIKELENERDIARSEAEILREERDVLKRRVQELETERDQLAEEYSARSYSRRLP